MSVTRPTGVKRRGTVAGLDGPWNQDQTFDSLLSREPIKRRKAGGLNTKFDNMIATVNMMPPPESNLRRRRASSASGSSSSVSCDLPKTPLDAYSDLEGGRLGKEFATIKRGLRGSNGGPPSPAHFESNVFRTLEETGNNVPAWLSEAVSTLDVAHPIRALVPATTAHTPNIVDLQCPVSSPRSTPRLFVRVPDPVIVEDIFAYKVPSRGYDDFPSAPVANTQVQQFQNHALPNTHDLPAINASPQEHFAPFVSVSADHHPSPMSYVDQAHTPPYKLTAMPKSSPPAPSGLSSEHDFLPSLYLSDGLATPFTTPGPFAHTTHKFSDDFADLRSSSSRASSASRTIAATRANSPDAFISVADILPYSTPGPLAVQTRSSSSYHMLNPDLTLRSPLLRDSLHLVPMETLQDDLTSSSPDLLADVPLVTPAPSPPRLSKSKLTSFITCIPRRIYFDTPAEDPVGSDPLDPADYELELDYDHLDFRWEKFKPSGVVISNLASRPKPHGGIRPHTELIDALDVGVAPPQLDYAMAEEPPGRSRFFMGEELPEVTAAGLSQESYYFQPDQMSLPQTQASASAQASGPVASPILRGPSFAPAPGIHISPLRGNVADNKEKENEMRGIVEDRSNGETLMKEQNEPPQAIPQTPIKQIMSSVPKTPYAPRNLIPISTAMSVPKIAVVRVDDASDDEIDDPEVNTKEVAERLSQDSHDSIESWSAG